MENSKLYIEHVIELLHAIANEQDVMYSRQVICLWKR